MKPRHLVVLAAGLALGVTALAVVRSAPGGSLAGASAGATVALAAVGWALIACGVVAWARRPASRFGPLLAAAGGAWFVAELNNPGAGSSLLFTLGLLGYAACPAVVAHAALAYPGGRVAGPARARRRSRSPTPARCSCSACCPRSTFDPAAQGCIDCPRQPAGRHERTATSSRRPAAPASSSASCGRPRSRCWRSSRSRAPPPPRGGCARRCCCRPPPTSRWSPPTTRTASRAASSPTTPSTTTCGSRRRRRSPCSRSASRGRGCASGRRARASRGS